MKHEDISALVDGEAGEQERESAISGLCGDRDARRAWQRYHLIGDVLRGGAEAGAQAAVTRLPQRRPRPARAPLAGLAIAASVAALALVLVLGGPADDAAPGFEVADRSSDAAAPAPAGAATAGAPLVQASPAVAESSESDRRLNGYLVNFNEQRARLGVPGVHPYVRIVGFEAR